MKLLDGASDQYASRIAVQTGSRIQIVVAEDIEWVGSAGNYVELHVNGRSFLLREIDGFSRTAARPSKVYPHTPLPDCAVKSNRGTAIHREPGIFGNAL
jgi:hypothetical protein